MHMIDMNFNIKMASSIILKPSY